MSSHLSTKKGLTKFWFGSHPHTTEKDQVIATAETQLANATLVVGNPITGVLPGVME